MKNSIFLLSVIISLSCFSCTSSRDKMSGIISLMESDIKTAQKANSNSVKELISAYLNFASKYAKDSLAPEYLYRAAGLANGFNRGTQSIELYETIIHTYPDYKRLPECYFMEAFAYENVHGNIGKASEYYNKFLEKYPDHSLADDARAALKYLGKSSDEMVKEFEKMNASGIDGIEWGLMGLSGDWVGIDGIDGD